MQKYEYKFVRLPVKKSYWTGTSAPSPEEIASCESAVHEHAAHGWRLVQIAHRGWGMYGGHAYFELILERALS